MGPLFLPVVLLQRGVVMSDVSPPEPWTLGLRFDQCLCVMCSCARVHVCVCARACLAPSAAVISPRYAPVVPSSGAILGGPNGQGPHPSREVNGRATPLSLMMRFASVVAVSSPAIVTGAAGDHQAILLWLSDIPRRPLCFGCALAL